MFTGQFGQQVHDYEPGIAKTGLFWTVPVPRESIAYAADLSTARFALSNLQIEDHHDFLNSIGLADPSIKVIHDTKVSFDTRWEATEGPTTLTVDDPAAHLHYTGDFRKSRATIAWSAWEPSLHFAFATDSTPQTNPQPAVIGRERNGTRFS